MRYDWLHKCMIGFTKHRKSIQRRARLVLFSALMLTAVACQRNQSVSPTSPPESAKPPYTTPLKIKNQHLYVEVAANNASWQQGLSGRERLIDSQGMLFDMRTSFEKRPSFWMKDMKFSLDIIWIDANRVVDITANISAPTPGAPLGSLQLYPPHHDIDMVLEVNAGWTQTHQIKIGDPVKLNLAY